MSFTAQAFVDQLEAIEPAEIADARFSTIEAIHAIWLEYVLESLPDTYRDPPLALMPTGYLAGTRAKIRTMRRRVAAGFSPFHPADSPELHKIGIKVDVGRNGRTSIGGFEALAAALVASKKDGGKEAV